MSLKLEVGDNIPTMFNKWIDIVSYSYSESKNLFMNEGISNGLFFVSREPKKYFNYSIITIKNILNILEHSLPFIDNENDENDDEGEDGDGCGVGRGVGSSSSSRSSSEGGGGDGGGGEAEYIGEGSDENDDNSEEF